MQHSAIVEKKGTVVVFAKTRTDMPEIRVWKLSGSKEFSELLNINFVVFKLQDNYYKCGFVAPDEDCYLCIKFADDVAFVRVGKPGVLLLHYSNDDLNYSYKQIDAADGRIIASGDLVKLDNGFYYHEIRSQIYSLIEITSDDKYRTVSVLKLPYPDSSGGTVVTSGYSAVENFVEIEKLAMVGFLGERKSGFDRTLGKWVEKETDVTVSDLARAIAYKYSLNWDIEEDESKWIGNYITYIKTQETTGSSLVYRPGSTPDNNRNNFTLISDDPLGNVIVKGLAIYVAKPLEIVNNIEGAVFGFRNKE